MGNEQRRKRDRLVFSEDGLGDGRPQEQFEGSSNIVTVFFSPSFFLPPFLCLVLKGGAKHGGRDDPGRSVRTGQGNPSRDSSPRQS